MLGAKQREQKETINRAAVEAGDKPPYELPDIDRATAYYMAIFDRLSTDRQIGMAMGPLPWASIEREAARRRIDPDELWQILSYADGKFLEHQAKQSDAASKSKKS